MGRFSFRATLLALAACCTAALAQRQLPGNSSLQGAYYLRYLGAIGYPCECAIGYIGTITFDGQGNFAVSGQGNYNNGSNNPLPTTATGQYQVYSSGMFEMANPFTEGIGANLYGGLGIGALVASSTDSGNPNNDVPGFLDLFVAIPASTASSNATLSGPYQVADMEFGGGSVGATINTLFSMTSNGAGSFGTVAIMGTSQALNSVPTSQASTGVTYSVAANGTGTLTLPAPNGVTAANTLLSGSKTIHVSADGSFFLGGSPSGYDMILGVKALPANTAPTLQGLYFTATVENLQDGSAEAGLYGADGSADELGDPAADELAHYRINVDNYGTYDQTYADTFALTPGGLASYPDQQFAAGAGGNIVIGSGNGTNYELSINVKLPPLSGSGVFLNPSGVVNAASSAPFTAQVAPGEVLTLYGTGLAAGTATASALPFPILLDGVGVTVNGTAAPIYYVSPTQISIIVPYSSPTDGSLVAVQVNNNGTTSNFAQLYSGYTSPGVFTVPAGGIGNGAILHANYALVSDSSPAAIGETVQIYLTGLGTVTPPVTAGSAAPTSTLSVVDNSVAVYIDGVQATVGYQGLAPGLAGLYQLNVTIPTGVSSGPVTLEISTVDADNIQATIPIQ
jgi:uncharacterized protein (TIGR03437 family)